jgi:hypothetical protein
MNEVPAWSDTVTLGGTMSSRVRRPDSLGEGDNHSATQINLAAAATKVSTTAESLPRPQDASSDGSPAASLLLPKAQKRKRSQFEMGTVQIPDFITGGLIAIEEAETYFNAFFSGCDRFVPIFDPKCDSFLDIRRRSSLLFSTICSIGCRVLSGTESHHWHLLSFHAQRMLNASIATPAQPTLETVQALISKACYSPERSLLIAVATRMALELRLPEAYDTLSARLFARETTRAEQFGEPWEDDDTLMKKTRIWLHLLVLGQILHVDAGDLPSFRFRGAVRRCRILLDSPYSVDMDLYLFCQVELNALRAKIYDYLSQCANVDDEDIMDMVRDAKIDIGVWFKDWGRIYEKHESKMPWLTPHLSVQRYWADSMALCRAVRASGVENVRAMSPTQKTILLMAKDSLKQHLDVILEEPRLYLRNLQYAMDFVWAKNAFCYLLLLKLSILLPDGDDQGFKRVLVEKGRILLTELIRSSGGVNSSGGRNNVSTLYIQLVRASIEKYSHALRKDSEMVEGTTTHSGNTVLAEQVATSSETAGGQNELESFVPEQFVFEWDFPGLTLFSKPTTEVGWFDDLLAGILDGGDDFYGLGRPSLDFTL